jgi:hypothetical protein
MPVEMDRFPERGSKRNGANVGAGSTKYRNTSAGKTVPNDPLPLDILFPDTNVNVTGSPSCAGQLKG